MRLGSGIMDRPQLLALYPLCRKANPPGSSVLHVCPAHVRASLHLRFVDQWRGPVYDPSRACPKWVDLRSTHGLDRPLLSCPLCLVCANSLLALHEFRHAPASWRRRSAALAQLHTTFHNAPNWKQDRVSSTGRHLRKLKHMISRQPTTRR